MFQPTKEWVNKVNLSSVELENFFKFGACVISARKAKQLDATTIFTYSGANTALGQSERAYYLSHFIICYITCVMLCYITYVMLCCITYLVLCYINREYFMESAGVR